MTERLPPTGTFFIQKIYAPPPLPYFKVNICPFPLPHFASIFFAYLYQKMTSEAKTMPSTIEE
jgi:hypothetical protein